MLYIHLLIFNYLPADRFCLFRACIKHIHFTSAERFDNKFIRLKRFGQKFHNIRIFELKLQYRLRLGRENEQAHFALRLPFAIFAHKYGNITMFSKNRIKQIRSLAMKKRRDESGLFVAEGPKLVGDMLARFRCQYMAVAENSTFAVPSGVKECDIVTHEELSRATLLTTPHEVIAVFEKPTVNKTPQPALAARNKLCLALDDIQDPGNVGTIIRTADWFGIDTVFCSAGTADVFSPKVLQATMGALVRVNVHYCDLEQTLAALRDEMPVYGTFLDGNDIYSANLAGNGIIVIGNEGNGISPAVERTVTQRLRIPSFPEGRKTVESLNASIATAVVCAEFRRRSII